MSGIHSTAIAITAIILSGVPAMGGHPEPPIDLGSAINFAILAKSGISTVPGSYVTGDMGVSPIDSTSITGFSLTLDSTTSFSTSEQVVGKVYAANYSSPTPSILTTAVGDMETAYADAAGRTLPDDTELGTGNISGMTLSPGLYKWSSSVLIDEDVILLGESEDIWIFQIAGNLTMEGSSKVLLSGGAQAENIFWQVAGGDGVDIGTKSHMEGIILARTKVTLKTGASINGRLLAQTAVTLESNAVTAPAGLDPGTLVLRSASDVSGPYTDTVGQYISPATKSITAPQNGNVQFYRIWSDPEVVITDITTPDGNVIITYE